MELKAGYKNTEVGCIPEDWDVKEFGVLSEKIIGGGTPSRSNPIYWGTEIPWVTVKDFSSFNSYQTQEYITKEGLKNSASHLIPKGTIITSTRMTLGKAVIYNVDVSINQDLKAIFPNKGIDTKYFYYWFEFNSKSIEKLGSGSTVLGLSLPDLRKIKVKLPSTKSEQTAIATALSDMDTLISQTEKLIEKKKAIKQGVMQELLRPKKGWEKKKISEAFNIFKGRGLSKNKISEYGEYPCILYGELFTTYKEEITEIFSKTNYSEAVNSVEGDILFPGSTTTTGADLAKASAIFKDGVQLGGDIIILRKYDFNLDSLFVTNFLNYYRKNEIAQLTKGITIHHLYGKDLSGIEIEFPNQSIQMSISNASRDLDLEISTLQKKLQKLIFEKQGMMQALLTGKIRLV